MAFKLKRSSLADKISSLVTAAPTTFNSDDENDETSAKLVGGLEEDEDDEIESAEGVKLDSKFRRQNIELLNNVDKRYEGKKVSRKTLRRSDSLSSETEEEGDLESGSEEKGSDHSEGSHNNEESGTDNDDEDASEDEEGREESDDEPELEIDEANPLLRRGNKNGEEGSFKHMNVTDVRAEIDKGNSVRGQLGIWENLLEMRIKLQKCLVSSNKMPQFDVQKSLRRDKNFTKSTNESKKNLSVLLDNLLELQNTLLKNYPETKQLGKGKETGNENGRENDEEILSDTDEEEMFDGKEEEEEEETGSMPRKKRKLGDYESLISKNHGLYTNYRNSVIQKWNDKTRVAVGNVNNKGSSQPVVKQIEFILSDKSKLRKRTQLKRSEYKILGKMETDGDDKDGRRGQEYDGEIYDDDDFYHQLLKELIEFKSADITDPIQLSKQWIQLQNMRSKMKRKIDTKATKGRRIRFGVHPKLVNFMAPITIEDQWTDEAKNELYNSLFGKIKETEEK